MTQASASTQIPPDSTSRRRGPDTAERILDAAEDYFGRKGYAGTTLRDVADQVGIRIPSLYNHFPNKAALYSAVLERGISPVLTLLSRSIQGDETEPAEAMDPKTTVRAVMHWLALRPSLPRLIQYELLAGGEQLAPLLSDWLQPAMSQGLVMMKTT
ncbi:MAG: TetR/AcrR family transcriptional regulator, partial [Myxococcota bacterium]|nr:TetR/AcrR family transcriptional regulator [Myxococcota bacterium]